MWVRLLLGELVLCCVGFVAGCSSSDGDDESREEGALPCNQSSAECRANFANSYQGTYTGDAAGSLILSADGSGDVVGTATSGDGSVAIFGSVNQFGKLTGETDDGTHFVGQIDGSGRVSGTWQGPGGSGTFAAVATMPVTLPPSGTGGSGSVGPAPSGGAPTGGSSSSSPFANDPRFTPSIAVICAATAKCGDDAAECEDTMILLRELVAEAGCIEELNALFTCAVNSGQCGTADECQGAYDALNTCG